jgi:peptide/nickel transport system substrate-binding protein
MHKNLRVLTAAVGLLGTLFVAEAALAQKPGGIFKVYHIDSPASMSIHEEATIAAVIPMMGVFNNLVLYDQHVPQNSTASIVPDLATEWSWDPGKTRLTFRLREGIKWHDGKTFTAKDVVCTWDMLSGKSSEKLRLNPRKAWYRNLEEVSVNGDYEVTFHLNRPQPAFLDFLASGLSPVYPCHVPPREMRQHPIGTGPFKFGEFKPNESISIAKNPNYWKKDRPFLDGVEYTIIRNLSTANLAFIAGKFDMSFPLYMQAPVMREVQSQAPQAICELVPQNVSRNLIVNRAAPPFDNADLRHAMALSLDRRAFIDILGEGHGDIGGAMEPPPAGRWGLPLEILKTLPGYDPDMPKNRAEARRIMERLGYGPDKPLAIRVSARNIPPTRDPAVILIDQLREIYVSGELEPVDTAQWYPKVMRKDYTVGVNVTAGGADEPDQNFYENYACGAEGNYDGYCNPELDRRIERQSMELDPDKRAQLVWEIDRSLQQDGARPIIFYPRGATCLQPSVKGLTIMINSSFNGWRMEDVWLDK